MASYQLNSIGTIFNNERETFIELETKFIPALGALDGFSHLNILWWCTDFDTGEFRSVLETSKPYKTAPEMMGIFATRSPYRPNPIGLTTVEVICIDYNKGRIQIPYIDANDLTPVLDIKPYTPSYDRVETPDVPQWCCHWPKSLEASAAFAWDKEFNF